MGLGGSVLRSLPNFHANPPFTMSRGQEILKRYLLRFLPYEMHENVRPDWLFGLELDFWFPQHNLAFEFQGGQHYVPRDGDRAALARQWTNDSRKKHLCRERGVLLIRIDAFHLGGGSLLGRIKAVASHNHFRLPEIKKAFLKTGEKRDLERQSVAYRCMLRETFNCPTAHRRGAQPRRDSMQARRQAQTGLL